MPDGWAPDMQAFYCGLDPTTKQLTAQDKRNIEDWYERTIGWSAAAGHGPGQARTEVAEGPRAQWEGSFRGALPKQMMPYFLLRHHTVSGNQGGMREAVLLGKAWGISNNYIVNTIVLAAYYFTGMESMDLVAEAVGDVL